MDKELGKQLATEALNILKGTKTFVVDQAPDFIQQVLVFEMAKTAITSAVSLFFLVGMMYGIHRLVKRVVKETDDESWSMLYLINIMTIIPATHLACSFERFLKAYLAPKVFLLEYFTGLLK